MSIKGLPSGKIIVPYSPHHDFFHSALTYHPSIPPPPPLEYIQALNSLGIQMEFNQNDSLLRCDYCTETLEAALDYFGRPVSLIIDMPSCDNASNRAPVSRSINVQSASTLNPNLYHRCSVIDNQCHEIARMRPRDAGTLIVVLYTAQYRTTNSMYVQDSLGSQWSLVNDDSFFAVGFVPGEKSAQVVKVMTWKLGELQEGELNEFQVKSIQKMMEPHVFEIKKRLLVVCDPHCHSLQHISWHTFASIGRILSLILLLCDSLPSMRVAFFDETNNAILQLDFRDGKCKASGDARHCFIPVLVQAVNDETDHLPPIDNKLSTTHALVALMRKHGLLGYKLWRMVLACKTAEEQFNNDEYVAKAVRHSQVICDYMDEDFSKDLLQDIRGACTGRVAALELLEKGEVKFGEHIVSINDIGPVDESHGHDHERQGALGLPRLRGQRIVDRIRVCKGRGQPLICGNSRLGFPTQGRRYVLRVVDGHVETKNVFRMRDMIRPLSTVTRFAISVLGFSTELEWAEPETKDDLREWTRITNTQANAILHGNYGTRAAMWLWSHIAHGDVVVSRQSKSCRTSTSAMYNGATIKMDCA